MHVGYYVISATIAKDIMLRDETKFSGYDPIILTRFSTTRVVTRTQLSIYSRTECFDMIFIKCNWVPTPVAVVGKLAHK